MESEGQVVVFHLPMEVIAQRVVCPGEVCLRVAAEGEQKLAVDRDLVDLLECRLPDVDAEIIHVDASRQRSATGVLNLIAEDEVIQQIAGEGMRLTEQRVVVVDVSLVGIGQQILQVSRTPFRSIAVVEVTRSQAIVRAEVLVEPGRDLAVVREVGLDEGRSVHSRRPWAGTSTGRATQS